MELETYNKVLFETTKLYLASDQNHGSDPELQLWIPWTFPIQALPLGTISSHQRYFFVFHRLHHLAQPCSHLAWIFKNICEQFDKLALSFRFVLKQEPTLLLCHLDVLNGYYMGDFSMLYWAKSIPGVSQILHWGNYDQMKLAHYLFAS